MGSVKISPMLEMSEGSVVEAVARKQTKFFHLQSSTAVVIVRVGCRGIAVYVYVEMLLCATEL